MTTYLPAQTPSHVAMPDGLDGPYHDGLANDRLVLPRCEECGTWQWPIEVLCWRCHRFGIAWAETEPSGVVFSWTRVWHPVRPYLEQSVPYVVVLVELPAAGGVRLLGNLLGDPTQPVRIGLEVIGVFEAAAPGQVAGRLQWRAADGAVTMSDGKPTEAS